MGIVYQYDKRRNITYAYESVAHWDKDKQQSRSKRTLIGRVDPETGEINPTRKKRARPTQALSADETVALLTGINRNYYGATYLFDAIGDKLGVTKDLRRCFPDTYEEILSIAYYLVLEDSNPLFRFGKWARTHKHPFGDDIPSQRSSDLFAGITEEAKDNFFILQGKRRIESEYWAYDTTSISSYSKCLKQVIAGKNKEHDNLEQFNLALLFGQDSNLPFYYRKLPGHITDVTTVKNLLADMDFFGYKDIKLVMDRGFYSEANVNGLYKEHQKFLMATKISLKFVQAELDRVREDMRTWMNYNQKHDLYAMCVPIKWAYTEERRYKGDILKSERRMYLHLYFNIIKQAEDEMAFNNMMVTLQKELESGERIQSHEKKYKEYFDVKVTPKRGIKVTAKQAAMERAKRNFGYFAFISNTVKDSLLALEIYRNKDVVEKAFGNLKERLNFRRALVSSELSLDGKLFVEFIALIFISYIKKHMQDANLFKKYTLHELLDKIDVIECFDMPDKKLRIGEVTDKQNDIYMAMDVKPISSLC